MKKKKKKKEKKAKMPPIQQRNKPDLTSKDFL